jgi:type II secretory pathway pseudopilin PulG
MIEMVAVMTIGMIMLAISVISIVPVLRTARTDTAASYVLNEMRHTRERAIDERREYRMTFVTNGVSPFATINVFQGNTTPPPAAPVLVFTLDNSINLPFDLRFIPPNPTPPAAPDGQLCGQGLAINFTMTGAACGSSPTLIFNPDGSITDVAGGFANGVIFMARQGEPRSTRAVSFFGATGRTKGWRMVPSGAAWAWSVQ